MMHRTFLAISCLAWHLGTSQAFFAVTTPRLPTTLLLVRANKGEQPSASKEEGPVECYVVNDELIEEEGEKPVVVCTSEPDEYAWFNGLDRDAMRPTDGVEEGSVECVEGASPRGIPEWECKQED
jgi:hypothetical protein